LQCDENFRTTIIVKDNKTSLRWEYNIDFLGLEVAKVVKKRLEDLETLLHSPTANEIGP